MPLPDLVLRSGGRDIPVLTGNEDIEWAAGSIAARISGKPRLFVVADTTVSLLYGQSLVGALQSQGFRVSLATFEPGETNKHLRTVSRLLDDMAECRIARDDIVIGIGGGVSTDIAGFAASVYQRGISWFAVPTSLMGIVDAAIGGKTGVDHFLSKNLIGTFHQPDAVVAPLKTLQTLPPREWKSGSAEVVKAALLRGGSLWDEVKRHGPDLHGWPRERVTDAVINAQQVKIDIVARDEKDRGERRLLNLGHTFGHALETATRYRTYSHGEAVFLGLGAAIRLSRLCGLMPEDVAGEIETVLASAQLPGCTVSADEIIAALQRDKKIRSERIHWVLLRAPGEAVITSDPPWEAVQDTAVWLEEAARAGESQLRADRRLRLLVLNGPNLNLLGEREPATYGSTSFGDLEKQLQHEADQLGVELILRQSNLEGDLISLIQQARLWADGIVLNPGGYTHTSVAMRDAIAGMTLPVVEVHLTDIAVREPFRRESLISPVCAKVISGKGIIGYVEAIKALQAMIKVASLGEQTMGTRDIQQ